MISTCRRTSLARLSSLLPNYLPPLARQGSISSAADSGCSRPSGLQPGPCATRWTIRLCQANSLYLVFCLLYSIFTLPSLVHAQVQSAPPPYLKNVGIDQNLNQSLPLDAVFTDETGRAVQLGDYFKPGRPVIITPVYYHCPGLCTEELNGLIRNLNMLKFLPGKDFQIVTFSFDPRETPALAAEKKTSYLELYHRPAGAGWCFLTGDQANIDRVTKAIGFRYFYDATIGQFAHATVLIIATPDGKLSRYFYNTEYFVRDLQFGVVEASSGHIGSPIDDALLYCYHYDPVQGRYGLMVFNLLRAGGIVALVLLVGGWWFMSRLARRRQASALAAIERTSPAGATKP